MHYITLIRKTAHLAAKKAPKSKAPREILKKAAKYKKTAFTKAKHEAIRNDGLGTLHEIVTRAITERLAHYEGNKTYAALSLGVSVRSMRNWTDERKGTGNLNKEGT